MNPDAFFTAHEESYIKKHGDPAACRRWVSGTAEKRTPTTIVTTCVVCGVETGKGRFCGKCAKTRPKKYRTCVLCGDRERNVTQYGFEDVDYYCRLKPECRKVYYRIKNTQKREKAMLA